MWSQAKPSAFSPKARAGARLFNFKDKGFLMFGGSNNDHQVHEFYNDLWVYSDGWKHVTPDGPTPPPRALYGGAVNSVAGNEYLWIWGGATYGEGIHHVTQLADWW